MVELNQYKLGMTYVTFEKGEVEDRTETLAKGFYVPKEVIYAVLTPIGSRDLTYREVNTWFKQLEKDAEDERIPYELVSNYRAKYEAWLKNEEIPDEGISIKLWPALSPAERTLLLGMHITTVEKLSDLNEEAILAIGMGGRRMVQRAKDWLKSNDKAASVAEVTKLRDENESMKQRMLALETMIKAQQEGKSAEKTAEQLIKPNKATA